MAKKVFDILLDEDGDLLFKNGDLVIGESTMQHQRLLLLAAKGDWKQHPLIGVDTTFFLNDDADVDEFHTAVQSEFEKDGMRVEKITGGTVHNTNIIAAYK